MAGEKKSGLGATNQYMDAFLEIPVKSEATDRDLVMGMGRFLAKKGYVREIRLLPGSWGFMYEDKCIYIPEQELSREQYDYYIFRLGRESKTGRSLWPDFGQEVDQYRFLHELSHAWQDYEIDIEGNENWHQRAIDGENDSPMAVLFRSCYRMRIENSGKGLSTFGNVPDYNSIEDGRMQTAARAWEDVNELVTMYLWNPDYFETYIQYLTGEIPGYGQESLDRDGLIRISGIEKDTLKTLVAGYVDEIRRRIIKSPSNWG